MAVGTGIGFDISQLDAEIKKADEALMSLGKTGERTSKQINEAFSLAKNGNIQDFISVIERLSNTLSKKGYNQAAQMVREIATETTGAIDRVNRFATLMQTINDGGRSNVKNGAIESLKYQLDEALSRLGVLNEQLQFYTKGEGAKAVGANVVDTSALQDEANKLRIVVELLQRRLEHEQALAALKRRSSSLLIQRDRDMDWQEMEEERTENLRRQSINAKEANKAYEQAYNDRYQMYASMYDKMWQKDLENFERQNASAKSGGQKYATEYEERQRFYEQWINQNYLQEQERTQQEAQQANERARNGSAAYQQELREKERFYLYWINKTYEADERRRKKEEEEEKKKNERIAAEAKKAAEVQARLDSESRKRRYHAYTTSYEGATRTSDKAKTLAQEIQAVKNLEAARAKLVKTDADYQKKLDDINARILQHNRNIAQATAGAKDLQNAHSKLGTTIASVFSIQAIRSYINQMIKVRGEMELQQRSLQAILQNKDAANEVWQKTIDLAVRSPFRIKDLVTYTKQLAAYRVESEKLYDTNKMLADVSAGLGVDMQRLILAFGQVKSANFLRGTELRQFTEAGIPMLDELAKLYTQMEGALVTSGDVFERISKRMVLFEDVEEVFKRMTAAGGTFYRMQEIQSETLKGQISNLKDSVDIMLNSMGKDMDGVLKKSVKSVKFLVDNYEVLTVILKGIIVALALYKVNSFAASEATLRMARTMKMAKISATGLGGAWTSLRVGLAKFWKDLGKTTNMLASNPWLLLAAAIVTAAIKLYQFRKELEEVDKKYSQLLDKQSDVYLAFRQAGQKSSVEEQVAERRKQLQALVDMAKNEYGLVIDINVGEIDESKLEEEFNKIRQKMIELNAFSASFSKEMIKSDKLSKWYGEEYIGLEEGLFEDIQDLGSSYEKLYQEMINKSGRTVEILRDKWDDLTDAQQKAVEDLEKPIQGDESLVDYVNRLKDAYTTLLELKDVKNNKISRFIRSFNRDVREANAEFKLFANRFREEVNGIADEKEKIEFLDVSIGAMADEKEWSEFEENYIRRLVEQEFEITFVPKTATPEELKSWQKSYNALFKGDSGFREITATATSQSQVIERLNGTYESLEETIKRIEAAGKDSVLAGGAYEGQDLNKLKSDLAEIQAQLDWFGAGAKKGGGGSGKDLVMEKLRNRINLIKEMNTEYEKLRKTFSDVDAIEKVKTAYEATAKELGLDASTMDFTDAGTIKSLEDLLGKPEYAANKYVLELQKALDNFKVELGITTKQGDDEKLKNDIQKFFDQYDLTLELKKLNMPPELAKSLFDVDYLDLDGLKKAVQAQGAKFIGTDMEKDYEDFLKKIDELERKALIDRTKTYLEYAKLAIGERAKIKLEELQKLKEIEETFAIKEGDSEETKAYKKDMRERASIRVKEEAEAALKNLEWDEFQKTETFTSLFADIDDASDALVNHMIKKIEEFKDAWKDMPLEDVRTMVNKLNELESALAERSPWEAYRTASEAIRKAREDAMFSFESEDARDLYREGRSDRDYIAALQIENAYQEEKASLAEKEAAVIEEILALKTKEREGSVVDLGLTQEQMKYVKMTEDELRDLLTIKKGEASTARAVVLSNGQILVQYRNQEKSLLKQKETLGEVQNMANDLYEAFTELAEALGADSESPAAIFADMGMNMMNAVLNTMMLQAQLKAVEVGAYAAGTALNTAMGVIGWIVMGVQLLAAGITAIAKINDNRIVAQLEEQAAIIEKQREEYEKIEKKVESAYNVDNLREYNAEMKRSVELEIQALEASIALEKSRKNVDEEQVKDYENQIAEARERLTESTQGMMEELNGIFDLSDFTSGFIDAWWDAMDEGKRGLDALNEHFNETMKDMVKKQALYRGAQEIMSQVQEAINKSLEGDFTVDEAEWQAIMNAAKQANVNLDEFLQGWYDMFGAMSDSAGGGLSALQKGIQGITEDTAQIIEAYLNSIRGYVSEQVTHTKNIYRILNDAVHSDAAAIRVRMV